MARTKSQAIDQATDIEVLRTVAHAMWDGLRATHNQADHVQGVMNGDTRCQPCTDLIDGTRETGCDDYQSWQNTISRAYGAI